MTKRKKPLDKSRGALTPVSYGTENIDNVKSPTSVEQPWQAEPAVKRMTFTELAEELTRRSEL